MSIEQDIYTEIQQLLSEYRQTLSVDTSDLLTLGRAGAGDAALTRWHEAGQSRFRAGLVPGSDDWRLQRSTDGTEGSYADVLTVDRATGEVAFLGGLSAGGLDVAGNVGIGKLPTEKLDVDGYARATGFYTADILIQNDTAATITTPSSSGFVFVTNQPASGYPQSNHSGFALFDVGLTPDITRLGGAPRFYTMNADVTGTSGAVPGVTVGVVAGALKLENRFGNAMTFRYTIIG